ncbi:TauD/TfdA family dioxygenase [Acaryochloris sp. IP29b_bin.148]|uniref:TauD/TfdA family dioxygenase n=1 Tax=Acaryochloris sp. IP29b_bin.148 TaxID=2969218 RepID=UPI002618C6D3|nr:TauD/TfdA family dioxygenase [Acaryochloris sp. IP29b_bin.148]
MPILTEPSIGHINDLADVISKTQFQPAWEKHNLETNPHWKIKIPDSILSSVLVLNHWLEARGYRWDSPEAKGITIKNLDLLAHVMRYHLTRTTGVVLLSGFDVAEFGESAGRLLLSQIGYALGSVLDKRGLLYDVCDRGQDYRQDNVLFSSTCTSPGYHTDSTDADLMPGIVALFCLRTAREGGVNRLANTLTAYQRLLKEQPEVLRRLCETFIRDKIVVDEIGTRSLSDRMRNSFPVFEYGRWYPGLTCRYMRYWIEAGHHKAELPLTDEDIFALDQFEAALNHEDSTYQLQLQPGDMIFLNNHLIVHDRTEYLDWEEPEKKRHLVRMWVGNNAFQRNAPKPDDMQLSHI